MSGFWWTIIIPNAASRVSQRLTALPVFEDQVTQAGLTIADINVPSEPLMRKDLYLDVNAPFEEKFRNGDSAWSLATESELQAGISWWKRMVETGKAAKALEDAEIARQLIGQTTSITS